MKEQFELERFEWQAPDRLEVAGTFHGLQEPPADKPVLVVSGDGGVHRLETDPESEPGPPEQGEPWCAQFVWDETPIPVEAAALALGPDLVVDLPAPGSRRTLLRPRFLGVRRTAAEAEAEVEAEPEVEVEVEVETEAESRTDIGAQAELVAAEQQIQELRAALERTEEDLARARADVETERSGRAADAERFREGLARVRTSGEQALSDAETEAAALGERLEAAESARADMETEAAAHRERVEAAETERAEAESEAAALAERLEAAETAQAEMEAEVATLREQVAEADALRQRTTALETAGAEAGEMRADAQRLFERLNRLADALDNQT